MSATWAEFEADAPELAARGRDLFRALESGPAHEDGWYGIGFLATVSRAGAPRLAPVCPIVAAGRLVLAAVRHKLADLDRDGRYVLHAFLGPDDAEFSLTGRALRVQEPSLEAVVRRVVAGTGMLSNPASGERLIELRIDRAYAARWENVGKPGTRPIRTSWTANEP